MSRDRGIKIHFVSFLATSKKIFFIKILFSHNWAPLVLPQQTSTKSIVYSRTGRTNAGNYPSPKCPVGEGRSDRCLVL